MDRIVRVGTHKADKRLLVRLKNHLRGKNKNGSIFRKNIGRAMLNRDNHPYLKTWNIKMNKKGNRPQEYDEAFAEKLEDQITQYLQEHMSFTCLPVATKDMRLRLEEGIIATLNQTDDFISSEDWYGRFSPIQGIAQSGLWLRQGLDGTPISMEEFELIKSLAEDTY
jgi:hypothetical protein